MTVLYPSYSFIGYKSVLNTPTLIGDINDVQLAKVPKQPTPFFQSVYRFDSGISACTSLASLPKLLAYADYLAFDFDSRESLHLAYYDALLVCNKLYNIKAAYEFYYSGGKGFHVMVPTSQFGFEPTYDEGILKRMAEGIKGDIKTSKEGGTFDPSIYNFTRVFRYPGTWNEGGQAYKIALTTDEDWKLEYILETAKIRPSLQSCPGGYVDSLPLNEALVALYEFCKEPVAAPTPRINSSDIFAPAQEGGRNESAFTLANLLFKKGLFRQDVEWIVSKWNDGNPKPLSNTELGKVVVSAEKGRIELAPANLDSNFHSIDGLLDTIPSEIASGRTKFKTGYNFLDSYTLGGFEAEELVFIAARSGNFKTAFLTNILQRGSYLMQKPCLFFSMEMGKKTLRPRLIQTAEDLTKGEVLKRMAQGDTFEQTREAFKYLTIVHLSNISTEQMMDLVESFVKKHGEIGAIGIDYLGLFRGCNNNTERTARQAQDLKTVIAKGANCPVFCLVQAKQTFEGREGNVELLRNCPKDSDSILDLGDYSLGMWSHFVTLSDATEERVLFGKFMKSRGLDSDNYKPNPYFALKWKKETMTLEDIIYLEKPPFKFRQLKEEQG